MEDITCELNGVKYVMLQVPFTRENNREMEDRIKRHNGITQGVKEVSKDYRYVIGNVMIPEKNIKAFNAEGYKRNRSDDCDMILWLPPQIRIIFYVWVLAIVGVFIYSAIHRIL